MFFVDALYYWFYLLALLSMLIVCESDVKNIRTFVQIQ